MVPQEGSEERVEREEEKDGGGGDDEWLVMGRLGGGEGSVCRHGVVFEK